MTQRDEIRDVLQEAGQALSPKEIHTKLVEKGSEFRIENIRNLLQVHCIEQSNKVRRRPPYLFENVGNGRWRLSTQTEVQHWISFNPEKTDHKFSDESWAKLIATLSPEQPAVVKWSFGRGLGSAKQGAEGRRIYVVRFSADSRAVVGRGTILSIDSSKDVTQVEVALDWATNLPPHTLEDDALREVKERWWPQGNGERVAEEVARHIEAVLENERIPAQRNQPGTPSPLTLLLEGVPGTGKTFRIGQLVQRLGPQVRGDGRGRFAATMHPATTYEDFVEGLRPSTETTSRRDRNQRWGMDAKACVPAVTEAPDAGGSAASHRWFWEDPVSTDPRVERGRFTLQDGFFLRVCAEAVHFPRHWFVVLLDEFNRCNIPKVMGDLLTTLEASKRATWNGEAWDLADCPCPSLPGSGRLFFVPDNVVVVATMNSSDRSVGSLDAALRRRFSFSRVWPLGFEEQLHPNQAILQRALDASLPGDLEPQKLTDVKVTMQASIAAWFELNKQLGTVVGADGMLGHSYLFDLQRALMGATQDRRWFHKGKPGHTVRFYWEQQMLPQLCEILEANHAVARASEGAFPEALQGIATAMGYRSLSIERPAQHGSLSTARVVFGARIEEQSSNAPQSPADIQTGAGPDEPQPNDGSQRPDIEE